MRSANYRLWGGIAAASALLAAGAARAAGVDDVPGASTAASNTSLIRDASSMTAGGMLAGISGGSAFGPDLAAIGPGTAGAQADGSRPRFGAWAGGGYLYTKFDNALLPYNGNLYSSLLGVDYAITKAISVGVAGGYENWNVKTDFDTGTLKTSGYSAAPYLRLALGRYV
ncbi:MAG TPA: autotransporter domain-containing protein, partial [Candidatus Sulfotelmatobacter sp.]|nr:autotransporter domain-containing protein [Candidatus Sulfotelmatobacter sp.]